METKCILLTSVGVETGPNVISALRQSKRFRCELVGVDHDPLAAGLYLCDDRQLVPLVDSPDYISKLLTIVEQKRIDILIPLLSKEILLFSRAKDRLDQAGVKIALPDPETIELCEHKHQFVAHLHRHSIPAPRLYEQAELADRHFPVFVKPTRGSSSRHAGVAHDFHDLAYYHRRAGEIVIQELLQGPEYTVDILCDLQGDLIVGVIRERLAVKDGKAVKAKTVKNERLMDHVRRLLQIVTIVGPANIQCIEHDGAHKFFELNPRFSAGGLPLTTKSGVNLPELLVAMLSGETIDRNSLNYQENVYMSRHLTEVFPEITDEN